MMTSAAGDDQQVSALTAQANALSLNDDEHKEADNNTRQQQSAPHRQTVVIVREDRRHPNQHRFLIVNKRHTYVLRELLVEMLAKPWRLCSVPVKTHGPEPTDVMPIAEFKRRIDDDAAVKEAWMTAVRKRLHRLSAEEQQMFARMCAHFHDADHTVWSSSLPSGWVDRLRTPPVGWEEHVHTVLARLTSAEFGLASLQPCQSPDPPIWDIVKGGTDADDDSLAAAAAREFVEETCPVGVLSNDAIDYRIHLVKNALPSPPVRKRRYGEMYHVYSWYQPIDAAVYSPLFPWAAGADEGEFTLAENREIRAWRFVSSTDEAKWPMSEKAQDLVNIALHGLGYVSPIKRKKQLEKKKKKKKKDNKSPSSSSSSVCKFFSQKGGCRYGDKCRHAHTATKSDGGPKKACRFYQRGSCRKGDECEYAHTLPDKPASPSPPKKEKK